MLPSYRQRQSEEEIYLFTPQKSIPRMLIQEKCESDDDR